MTTVAKVDSVRPLPCRQYSIGLGAHWVQLASQCCGLKLLIVLGKDADRISHDCYCTGVAVEPLSSDTAPSFGASLLLHSHPFKFEDIFLSHDTDLVYSARLDTINPRC